MRHYTLPLATAAWIVAQSTAFAATASEAFSDVPAGHWAESAVTFVAVDRAFMKGYPDGSFRGDQPFTRLQLALSVSELVRELETISKTSWASKGLGGYAFKDLPADPAARATALRMANEYRLFDGVPGVTSQTLEADKQVTRYEMAKVVHRLLRLGEEKGLVDPTVQRTETHLFSDVPPSAWAYNEVKEVADRYQVMVGFPDATFRGPEELTRYQFAASAAQTFPLVRALVQQTQDANKPPTDEPPAAAPAARFQEFASLHLGVTGRLNGPVGPAFNGRFAHYFGGSPFFALVDTNLGTPVGTTGERLYNGALNVGYAFPLGSSFYLQPYLGGRAASNLTNTLGAVNYGAVAYARPTDSLGWFLNANGASGLGSTTGAGQGLFFGGASTGFEYYFQPKLGLTAEVGYGLLPTLQTATFGTEGAVTGTVGLVFGF
jgi:hypothetical protein